MFTDIVGSTRMVAALGDRAVGANLWSATTGSSARCSPATVARRSTRPATGSSRRSTGRPEPCSARRRSSTRCRPLGIEVRAGVHTGEVETIDGKGRRDRASSIGARVGAQAGPSEVLVSQTVKDLVAGSGLTFEDAGEHELKGVPDRWHLYRVVS